MSFCSGLLDLIGSGETYLSRQCPTTATHLRSDCIFACSFFREAAFRRSWPVSCKLGVLSCPVLYTPQAGRTLRAGGRAGPPPPNHSPPQYMLKLGGLIRPVVEGGMRPGPACELNRGRCTSARGAPFPWTCCVVVACGLIVVPIDVTRSQVFVQVISAAYLSSSHCSSRRSSTFSSQKHSRL
jgi:hypothetical protein